MGEKWCLFLLCLHGQLYFHIIITLLYFLFCELHKHILAHSHVSNIHFYLVILMLIIKIMGFPVGSGGKESACNVGDLSLIPGLGRSPGRRAWQPTPLFLPGESTWTEEPGGLQYGASFHVFVSHLCVFFGELSTQVFYLSFD